MQSAMLLGAIRFVAPEPFPRSLRAEVRYPFFSRSLVEFLFAIPHSQKQRPHESRSLMRRAFRELLPPRIGLRESKGSVDEAVCRALNAAIEEVESLINQRLPPAWEVLDREALIDGAQDVLHGGSTNRGDILRLIALSLFTAAMGDRTQARVLPVFPKTASRISVPVHREAFRQVPVAGAERTSH